MSENYKITKEIGLRILELRQEDGLTFPKISAQIKAEFGVDVVRSSIERFYKNFLKGSSRILPNDVVNIRIKHSDQFKTEKPLNKPKSVVETSIEDFSDISILNSVSDGKGFNQAKRPSDELLSLFNPNKHTK
ncbi:MULTISPECIES: hypothetical protein [unclassified Acinetobacter]|uniref:hypothetical protein n=1 Tax=unclassified Acinetobacter TaxID=196816 RepID=UPI002577C240|nr:MULTISPECIES: hypothetical protein [unclassified Acinetobacter]MDM1766019.1 hypothetical protein [Acinetobacter sp. 226-1]MDM1769774.1 hypothetical protein [Acinetobacter sp. 226-4]